MDRAQYDQLTWAQLHVRRIQRGSGGEESEEALKMRLAPKGAAEDDRKPKGSVGEDAPIYVGGTCERAPG